MIGDSLGLVCKINEKDKGWNDKLMIDGCLLLSYSLSILIF